MLTLDEYQKRAQSTAIYPKDEGLTYTVLGLNGEAGEVANEYKKVFRDDDGVMTFERSNRMIDELGDTLWYVALSAAELGVTLEELAQRNLTKLAVKYPKGGAK
jgi:NTP pyrophosphatase (non-canonical NTP hydrolase)